MLREENNMIDMGRKQEQPTSQPAIEGEKIEPKITYPTFSITDDQIPDELNNAKNNDKCRLEIIVRKIGDNIDTYAKGEPRRIELEIHKLGYIGKKVSVGEYKNMSNEEKDKVDEAEILSGEEKTGEPEEKE